MRKLIALLMVMALIMLGSTTAFAAGGNGDGSGGGSDEALGVESATIENGATVDPEVVITLVFTKNICHASVRENNRALVKLADGEGNDVAVTVTLCDDQIEPEKKNDMVIAPAQALAEGTYTLTVQAGVTSKSKVVMAEDYVLSFTVAQTAEAPIETPDTVQPEAEGGSNGTIMIIVGVAAVIVAGAIVLAKKRG